MQSPLRISWWHRSHLRPIAGVQRASAHGPALMHCTALSLLVLALLGSGCASKGPRFDPRDAASGASNDVSFVEVNLPARIEPAMLQPPRDAYRIGPGDVITIEVLGENASATSLMVGPDGKIYYSLLPGLSVWGLTLSETQQLIEREMARFAKVPSMLVVNLKTVGSKRVWLFGSGTSGVFTLATPTTLLEAVSTAGTGASTTGASAAGPSSDDPFDFRRSFVLRDGRRLPVNFERLLKFGDLGQNIYLQPDDFVYLPPKTEGSVYVFGAVAGPTAIPYTRDLTMAGALARAGSTIKYSHSAKVAVLRGSLTSPRIAEVDVQKIRSGRATNFPLEPGDIIYVPKVPGWRILELAEQTVDQFVRSIAANQGTYLGTGDERSVGFGYSGAD